MSSVSLPLVIVTVLLSTLGIVGLEDAFSAYERNRCKKLTDSHKVVTLRAFTGSASFCADRRYL
jgi:hypothetical protein